MVQSNATLESECTGILLRKVWIKCAKRGSRNQSGSGQDIKHTHLHELVARVPNILLLFVRVVVVRILVVMVHQLVARTR